MIGFDERADCPKCGHDDITVHYCRGRESQRTTYELCWKEGIEDEHLHRKCCRCHYEWLEKCIELCGPVKGK